MTLNAPYDDPATPSAVILRGMDEVEYDDLPAASDIRPGMVLERHSEAQEFAPHSTAGASGAPLVAVLRRDHGMVADESTVIPTLNTNEIHDEYLAGDVVLSAEMDKGHRFYGLLTAGVTVDAAAANVPLVSNGDGTLRPANTNGATGEADDGAIFEAVESVDASGATDAVRIRVEVRT